MPKGNAGSNPALSAPRHSLRAARVCLRMCPFCRKDTFFFNWRYFITSFRYRQLRSRKAISSLRGIGVEIETAENKKTYKQDEFRRTGAGRTLEGHTWDEMVLRINPVSTLHYDFFFYMKSQKELYELIAALSCFAVTVVTA